MFFASEFGIYHYTKKFGLTSLDYSFVIYYKVIFFSNGKHLIHKEQLVCLLHIQRQFIDCKLYGQMDKFFGI